MDNLKSFKGYDRVSEEDNFKIKSRNRKIIISISLFVLLVLIIVIVAGALVNRSNNHRSGNKSSPAAAVGTICSVTQYRDACITSLSSANSTDPERIFQYSLSVVMTSLKKLSNFPNEYAIRHGDAAMVREALDVCGELLNHSIETLNDTVSAMDVREGQSMLSSQKIEDIRTWLSTVITNQETCLDALEGVNATFVGEIRDLTKNATEFTSNSLAIISRIVGVLADFNIPLHRRRRLLNSNHGFPYWVSSGDRRLLQFSQHTPDIVVARDGSGNVTTIGAAVKMIPHQSDRRFIIYVKAGVYVENVNLTSNLWNVMIYGDGSNKTIISGSRNFFDGTSTYHTATFAVTGKSFIARDIGFRNSAGPAKYQAVALRSGSDQSVFYRCLFDGFQDTLYTYSNRQFYRECTIIGTIDFIFGTANVVLQNCSILARQPLRNQYNAITAQGNTQPNQNGGISIQRCVVNQFERLTVETYLGRQWKDYSTTVFMETNLGGFINPQGWIPMNDSVIIPPRTIFYGEYQNGGAGAGTGNRVNWTGVHRSLTAQQASRYNVVNFIQGRTWLPTTGVVFQPT